MRQGERERGGERRTRDGESKRIKNVKFMHRGGSALHMAHCTNVFTSYYGPRREGVRSGTHLCTATFIRKTNHIEQTGHK